MLTNEQYRSVIAELVVIAELLDKYPISSDGTHPPLAQASVNRIKVTVNALNDWHGEPPMYPRLVRSDWYDQTEPFDGTLSDTLNDTFDQTIVDDTLVLP